MQPSLPTTTTTTTVVTTATGVLAVAEEPEKKSTEQQQQQQPVKVKEETTMTQKPAVVVKVEPPPATVQIKSDNSVGSVSNTPTAAVVATPTPTCTLPFWNPLNKTAKKRYDREFLLSLKEKGLSKQLPEN